MKSLSTIGSGVLFIATLCLPSLSHAGSILIENTDTAPGRTMSNVTCAVDFFIGSNHYYDWQDLGTWQQNSQVHWGIVPSRCSCSGTECQGDCLYDLSQTNPTTGMRLSIDKGDNPTVYSKVYAECWFTINGACHYDWEYLGDSWDGSGDFDLVLNGMNGTWDGSCWGGDFLRSK